MQNDISLRYGKEKNDGGDYENNRSVEKAVKLMIVFIMVVEVIRKAVFVLLFKQGK